MRFLPKPRLQQHLRTVGTYLIVGLGLGVVYSLLSRWSTHSLLRLLVGGGLRGGGIGALLGISEVVILAERFRKKSFLAVLMARAGLYSAIVGGWLLLMDGVMGYLFEQVGYATALREHVAGGHLLADISFSLFLCLLLMSLLQITR